MQWVRRLRKNKDRAVRSAAEKLFNWQLKRFVTNMQGGGDWQELSEETIRAKKRRGVAPNPHWILYEYGELFNSLRMRRAQPNQYYGVRYVLGMVTDSVNTPPTYKGKTVQRIAQYHHRGIGRNPQRKIMVDPPASVWRRISAELRKELGLKPQ